MNEYPAELRDQLYEILSSVSGDELSGALLPFVDPPWSVVGVDFSASGTTELMITFQSEHGQASMRIRASDVPKGYGHLLPGEKAPPRLSPLAVNLSTLIQEELHHLSIDTTLNVIP